MIFVYQILVLMIIYFLPSHNFVLKNTYTENITPIKDNVPDINRNTSPNPLYFFKNKSERNKVEDLKQNVFDKMLSEEMLSLKNSFHQKDMTYTQTQSQVSKLYVQTPTIEIKQKWDVVENMKKIIANLDQQANEYKNVSSKEKLKVEQELIPDPVSVGYKKNLGLRSLALGGRRHENIGHVPCNHKLPLRIKTETSEQPVSKMTCTYIPTAEPKIQCSRYGLASTKTYVPFAPEQLYSYVYYIPCNEEKSKPSSYYPEVYDEDTYKPNVEHIEIKSNDINEDTVIETRDRDKLIDNLLNDLNRDDCCRIKDCYCSFASKTKVSSRFWYGYSFVILFVYF